MYCPNCNKEYDGKFCPECGTKLIDKPSASGFNINLGDANTISGGVNLNDSHNVHNEDKSVHNISNVSNVTNNVTQVVAQKTEIELLQEKKSLYLNECKRAYEDNVLEQAEVIALEEYRIKIGLDKATADNILEKVRQMTVGKTTKTGLNPIAKIKLKLLTERLLKNEIEALMNQIDELEPLVNKYDYDELLRKYYLVLSALKSEKCIQRYESTPADNYWESFFSYLAYCKIGKNYEAENILASIDRFADYPEDNISLLAVAGTLIKGNTAEAKDFLSAVTGDYTPALQRFVDSIYLILDPEMAKEMGADANTCAFYLVNFFGQEDPKEHARKEAEAKAAEERRRREEEAARIKAEQEAKAKAEEAARIKAEQEAKAKAEESARIKAEQEAKAKAEEEERIKAEQEAKAKAEEEARIKAEQEAKAKAEEEARIKAEQEAKAKAEEEARIKAEQEAKAKAEEEARIKAEQEARTKAEEEARIKAEQEAKAKAEEEARIKAEQEAKAKAEEEAHIKAEQEAKAKTEDEELTPESVVDGLLNDQVYFKVYNIFSKDDKYFVCKYLVTQREWEVIMGDNPSWEKSPNYPVVNITYAEAEEFVKRINKIARKKIKREFIIPPGDLTWLLYQKECAEVIKRDATKDISDYAWHKGNSEGHLHNVGELTPINGLYDALGLVYEMNKTKKYNSYYYGAFNTISNACLDNDLRSDLKYVTERYNDLGLRLAVKL